MAGGEVDPKVSDCLGVVSESFEGVKKLLRECGAADFGKSLDLIRAENW